MPTQEKIDKLRSLYIQRETLWKQMEGLLSEIGRLLLEEPDYKKWLENDGQNPLPEWIHLCTGGRPMWLCGEVENEIRRKTIKRISKPREKQQTVQQKLATGMFTQLMKGFK